MRAEHEQIIARANRRDHMARVALLAAATALAVVDSASNKCVLRRNEIKSLAALAEVNGMEMGEVTVIESAPEATVKAVEVPPPPVEGTPNPVRAEGEMI